MSIQLMGRLIQRFLAHVLPNVVRPLHALWNQVIGFLFLVLAAMPVPSIIRNVREYRTDSESAMRLVFLATFAVIMLYFGLTSLWRARKISRS
jgi:hypothetical protein